MEAAALQMYEEEEAAANTAALAAYRADNADWRPEGTGEDKECGRFGRCVFDSGRKVSARHVVSKISRLI